MRREILQASKLPRCKVWGEAGQKISWRVTAAIWLLQLSTFPLVTAHLIGSKWLPFGISIMSLAWDKFSTLGLSGFCFSLCRGADPWSSHKVALKAQSDPFNKTLQLAAQSLQFLSEKFCCCCCCFVVFLVCFCCCRSGLVLFLMMFLFFIVFLQRNVSF